MYLYQGAILEWNVDIATKQTFCAVIAASCWETCILKICEIVSDGRETRIDDIFNKEACDNRTALYPRPELVCKTFI